LRQTLLYIDYMTDCLRVQCSNKNVQVSVNDRLETLLTPQNVMTIFHTPYPPYPQPSLLLYNFSAAHFWHSTCSSSGSDLAACKPEAALRLHAAGKALVLLDADSQSSAEGLCLALQVRST